MRIAISSRSGCGNTTVTTMLSERIGYPMVNFTFRQMAQERGVDFWTFCRMAEDDYDIDRELDRRQVEMAMKEENCILASRLAVWMLKDADLKVYLTATPETRAGRIFKREGGSLEERYNETVRRDENDTNRYRKIYGIDNSRPEDVADIIIATDDKTPGEIVDIIVDAMKKKESLGAVD
ncbi:MAG: (d)CMP kinase [Candidatus Ornithospirochaeta sp.]